MSVQTLLYLIPYLVSVAISTGVGLYAWRHRTVNGATPFAIYALAQASMTLSFILELVSPGLEAKIFWDNTQWVGTVFAPLAGLAFALQYTERTLPHPKRTWGLLTIVPVAFILLMMTNSFHGLIRPAAQLVPGEPFAELTYNFTTAVWLIAIYAYMLALASIFILLQEFIHSHPLYRRQIGTVLLGRTIPMIGVVLTLFTFYRWF